MMGLRSGFWLISRPYAPSRRSRAKWGSFPSDMRRSTTSGSIPSRPRTMRRPGEGLERHVCTSRTNAASARRQRLRIASSLGRTPPGVKARARGCWPMTLDVPASYPPRPEHMRRTPVPPPPSTTVRSPVFFSGQDAIRVQHLREESDVAARRESDACSA